VLKIRGSKIQLPKLKVASSSLVARSIFFVSTLANTIISEAKFAEIISTLKGPGLGPDDSSTNSAKIALPDEETPDS